MKNNFFIFFFPSIFINSFAFANDFIFTSSEIKILNEGDYVEAIKGKAISKDGQIEIKAQKFEYKKDLEILRAMDGIHFLKPDNIEIKFKEIKIDQKNLIITTKAKTTITDQSRNLSVETEFVNYDKKSKILKSDSKSLLKDKFNNSLSTESFYYDIRENILKVTNSILKDTKNNTFKMDLAVNTKSNKLFGKDIEIDLNNEIFSIKKMNLD